MSTSPNDNFLLKDGNDNPFKLRGKDVSSLQDGSLQVVRHFATLYPVDYGIGGCFHRTVKSGTMGAGLAAGAPILAFRNISSTLNALVRRVRFAAWTLGAGFTAGVASVEMYVARSFSVQDTGGSTVNLTAPQAKLSASMAAPVAQIQYGSTGTLTAGSRILEVAPIDAINAAAPTGTNAVIFGSSPVNLFNRAQGEHPLLLVQNEGFVLQASVPATGTWGWTAAIEWDEVPLVNF